jgi:hypothetical protein
MSCLDLVLRRDEFCDDLEWWWDTLLSGAATVTSRAILHKEVYCYTCTSQRALSDDSYHALTCLALSWARTNTVNGLRR